MEENLLSFIIVVASGARETGAIIISGLFSISFSMLYSGQSFKPSSATILTPPAIPISSYLLPHS